MTKYTIPDFCADLIDIFTNSAVITNVVTKRVHYIKRPAISLPDPEQQQQQQNFIILSGHIK